MDRTADTRERGRIGIFGTMQSYAGSSGCVTHELIGRDLNPLGRGDGNAYVAGALNLGRIYPALPQSRAVHGTGSSVNNQGQLGEGCNGGCSGDSDFPLPPGAGGWWGDEQFDPKKHCKPPVPPPPEDNVGTGMYCHYLLKCCEYEQTLPQEVKPYCNAYDEYCMTRGPGSGGWPGEDEDPGEDPPWPWVPPEDRPPWQPPPPGCPAPNERFPVPPPPGGKPPFAFRPPYIPPPSYGGGHGEMCMWAMDMHEETLDRTAKGLP